MTNQKDALETAQKTIWNLQKQVMGILVNSQNQSEEDCKKDAWYCGSENALKKIRTALEQSVCCKCCSCKQPVQIEHGKDGTPYLKDGEFEKIMSPCDCKVIEGIAEEKKSLEKENTSLKKEVESLSTHINKTTILNSGEVDGLFKQPHIVSLDPGAFNALFRPANNKIIRLKREKNALEDRVNLLEKLVETFRGIEQNLEQENAKLRESLEFVEHELQGNMTNKQIVDLIIKIQKTLEQGVKNAKSSNKPR